MHVPILYEDNHLLVVEKPINIPVQADRSGDQDLLTILKADLKIRYQKPGNVYLGLVHRLDRPVGGVMVFAKTSKAASRLADQLRRWVIQRQYLAVVRGKLSQQAGILEHYLVKDRQKNIVTSVSAKHKQAKKAILQYRTIAYKDKLSLLSVKLETGRSHQIRVQLAAVGNPLYGDQKYGRQQNSPGEQLALWAYRLQFEHPTKKEPMIIQAPPPHVYPWKQWSTMIQ